MEPKAIEKLGPHYVIITLDNFCNNQRDVSQFWSLRFFAWGTSPSYHGQYSPIFTVFHIILGQSGACFTSLSDQ